MRPLISNFSRQFFRSLIAQGQRNIRPLLGGFVAGVYFIVNVPGVYAVESSFWSDRREQADRRRSSTEGTLLARLPMNIHTSLGDNVFPAVVNRLSEPSVGTASHLTNPALTSPALEHAFGWLPRSVAPYGDVREVYLSPTPGAPLIIHLQDVHEVAEAQRNLAGMTNALGVNKNISLVGMEGAVGPFSMDAYRRYPDADINRALADLFLTMGYFSGPEVAAITGDRPPLLWGVENASLYRENIAAFENSEKAQTSMASFVARLSVAAEKARTRFGSSALRTLESHRLAYQAHEEGLADYAAHVWSLAPGGATEYKNIQLLRKAQNMEEHLDFARVENERRVLVDILSNKLSEKALEGLVQESLDYRAGRLSYGDYHDFLRRLCANNGVNLNRFVQLNDYISYVLLAERIDRNALLQELDALEASAQTAVAHTPEEKALVSVGRSITLLEKLIHHGFAPSEWASYVRQKPQLLALPQTLAQLGAGPIVGAEALSSETLGSFEQFYARALDRNEAMMKNLLDKMRAEKTSTAALVAGGFHTAGLAQWCRQQGVSYAVVSPRLTKVPTDVRPLDVFARAPLPLEKLLAGEVIHLASARLGQSSDSPALLAQENGRLRQTTAQIAWASFEDYLLSQAAHFTEADQNKFRNFAGQFSSLENISTRTLQLPGSLRAMAVRVTTKEDGIKEFAILSSPGEAEQAFENLDATPVFQGTLNLPNGSKTLRVYALEDLTKNNFLKNVSWMKIQNQEKIHGIIQKFRTRLRDVTTPKSWREVFLSPRKAAVVATITMMAFLLASPYVRGGGGAFVSPVWDILLGLSTAIFGLVLHYRWGKKNTRPINEDQNQISFLESSDPNRKEKGFVSPVLLVGLGVIVSTLVMPGAGPVPAFLAGLLTASAWAMGFDALHQKAQQIQGVLRESWKDQDRKIQWAVVLLVFGLSLAGVGFGVFPDLGMIIPTMVVMSTLPGQRGLISNIFGNEPDGNGVLNNGISSDPNGFSPQGSSPSAKVKPNDAKQKKTPLIDSDDERRKVPRVLLHKALKGERGANAQFYTNFSEYFDLLMAGTDIDRAWLLEYVNKALEGKKWLNAPLYSTCGYSIYKWQILSSPKGIHQWRGHRSLALYETIREYKTAFEKLAPMVKETGKEGDIAIDFEEVKRNGIQGAIQAMTTAGQLYDENEFEKSKEAREWAVAYLDQLEISKEERKSNEIYSWIMGSNFHLAGMAQVRVVDEDSGGLDQEKRQEALEEALQTFDHGLEYLPESPLALTQKAGVSLRLDRREEAREAIDGAIQFGNNLSVAHAVSGQLFYLEAKEDDPKNGKELLTKALKEFETAKSATDKSDSDPHRNNYLEAKTLLRLSALESEVAEKEKHEARAREILIHEINEFLGPQKQKTPIFLHILKTWVGFTESIGFNPIQLDMVFSHKDKKKLSSMVELVSEAIVQKSRNLDPWVNLLVPYAKDDNNKGNRVLALRVLVGLGRYEEIRELLSWLLNNKRGELAADLLVDLPGEELSKWPASFLLELLSEPSSLAKPKVRNALLEGVKNHRQAARDTLEEILNSEFISDDEIRNLSADQLKEAMKNAEKWSGRFEVAKTKALEWKIDLKNEPLNGKIKQGLENHRKFVRNLEKRKVDVLLQEIDTSPKMAKLIGNIEYVEGGNGSGFEWNNLSPTLKLIKDLYKADIERYPEIQGYFEGIEARINNIINVRTGRDLGEWMKEVQTLVSRLERTSFQSSKVLTAWKSDLEEIAQELSSLQSRQGSLVEQPASNESMNRATQLLDQKKIEWELRSGLQPFENPEGQLNRFTELNQELDEFLKIFQSRHPEFSTTEIFNQIVNPLKMNYTKWAIALGGLLAWQGKVDVLIADYNNFLDGNMEVTLSEDEEENLEALEGQLEKFKREARSLLKESESFHENQNLAQNVDLTGWVGDLDLIINTIENIEDYPSLWHSEVSKIFRAWKRSDSNDFETRNSLIADSTTKLKEMESYGLVGMLAAFFPNKVEVLKFIVLSESVSGGRWPWLEGFYRRAGGWTGLVVLPVLLESVLAPVLLGSAAGLWSGVPLAALLVYQGVWHLFHLPGAREWGFVFSKEKLLISTGVVLSVLAVPSFGWVDPSGLSLWAAALVLAVPHAIVNGVMLGRARRSLENGLQPTDILKGRLSELLLGGPARSQIAYTRYAFSSQDIQRQIETQRITARAQRESLAFVLGLSPKTSLENMLLHLGQTHQRGQSLDLLTGASSISDNSIEKQQGHDIGRLLALADPRQNLQALVRFYHLGQGLLDAEARLNRSLESKSQAQEPPRAVLIEISKTLLQGNSTLDPRDQTLLNRLMELANKSPEERQRLTWVLPEGTKVEELQRLFEREEALNPLSEMNLENRVVVRSPPPVGKLNSITTLLSKAQGQKDWTKLTPADIYVLDPSEWDMSDLPKQLEGLVHVLVFLAGDLVFDMTGRLAEEVKRLNVVSINA